MTPDAVTTRERIIDASAELFRRQGFAASGLKRISDDAGAPLGSLYHFFPGGKEELGDAVIRRSGEFYRQLFETIAEASPDVVSGVRNFFVGAAETLRATDYADACPIATVALEVASTHERLRIASADVFRSWIEALAGRLRDAGMAGELADEVATSVLASLEGAFVLSRAMKSTFPVEVAGHAAVAMVETALGRAPDPEHQ